MNRTDPEIRASLLPMLRASHPDALLVQEWGVVANYATKDAGSLVVDVAAIGADSIEAWEIKSDADSTTRLSKQAPLYSALFDRCTVVSAPRHLARVRQIVPAWWGITVAAEAELWAEREAQANPCANIAGLLWSVEMAGIARTLGIYGDALAKRRADCKRDREEWIAAMSAERRAEYEKYAQGRKPWLPKAPTREGLAETLATVPRERLASLVCATIRNRTDWRRDDGYRVERGQAA